jgi:CxxC motif-containing protein (DUF1111 family)
MVANLRYYLLGALLILAPVGLRVLTWQRPPEHGESAADVQAGKELFTRTWAVKDPLCRGGDGLGPVYNATSCVACHKQGGLGGGGDNTHNVTVYVLQQPSGQFQAGILHAFATRGDYLETLSRFDRDLPNTSRPSLDTIRQFARRQVGLNVLHLSQRNTPALFGSGYINGIPDRVLIAEQRKQQLAWGVVDANTEAVPVGRAFRLPDGRIGKFGWKSQVASLRDFVQAACANELGLGNPSEAQPRPIWYPDYRTPGPDLTQQQCDQIAAYCASLPRPIEYHHASPVQRERVAEGKKLFHSIGCAHCHTPDLGDVQGIYSDLLLHRMGMELVGTGVYYDQTAPVLPGAPSPGGGSALPDEWRTPPLWGVAQSAPYLHDGRAPTLHAAIKGHGGQGAKAAQNYDRLSATQREQLLSFLESLRAPEVEHVVRQ